MALLRGYRWIGATRWLALGITAGLAQRQRGSKLCGWITCVNFKATAGSTRTSLALACATPDNLRDPTTLASSVTEMLNTAERSGSDEEGPSSMSFLLRDLSRLRLKPVALDMSQKL